MKTILNITMKEFKSYFYSPLAYVVLCVFSILSGYFFTAIIFETKNANAFSSFVGVLSELFLILIPVITMKLFAEENKAGTFELLLSYPLKSWHIVCGKFLGAFLFTMTMLIPVVFYISFLQMYSVPDYGLIITSLIGLVMLIMTFVSVGLFSSVITKSQVVASISGFGILLLLWAIDWFKAHVNYTFSRFLSYISLKHNFNWFVQGIVDTRAIVLFATFTVFMLLVTVKIIEDKRYSS
ncbi:MAG: ABC transporter permease subunit [Candidatus Muirbacterium halophilum]|nr:ABC transporter permease subunit [Candidatus Muirbacterium halophilum]MCK9475110.1 ABC transporter permease subunit [Candidatus Muirbacterium halophilum]